MEATARRYSENSRGMDMFISEDICFLEQLGIAFFRQRNNFHIHRKFNITKNSSFPFLVEWKIKLGEILGNVAY